MIDDWFGLYHNSWIGEIVPEAFAHPAKYSRGLIRKIYTHAVENGWLQDGNIVADPFAGVALGGLDAMLKGLMFVGVELEPRFVDLGDQNIKLWNSKYRGKMPKWGMARIIQGDSRNFAEIVKSAGCAISSPPYGETINSQSNGIDWNKAGRPDRMMPSLKRLSPGINSGLNYGISIGQLGSMPTGDIQSVISSPPYENHSSHDGRGYDDLKIAKDLEISRNRTYKGSFLKTDYGNSENQLGHENGEIFWGAAKIIVEQVYQVLPIRGHAIWILKDYVKAKKIVPFCNNWRLISEACGFTTLHEHRAWLIEDKGTNITLEGEMIEHKIERKSYFRRLAEKKGSPRIDYEIILCMVKTSADK